LVYQYTQPTMLIKCPLVFTGWFLKLSEVANIRPPSLFRARASCNYERDTMSEKNSLVLIMANKARKILID